jgi:hypothetical protein
MTFKEIKMNNNNSNSEDESGDPGRTPGSAEGDRETVEEDLKEKHLDADSQENEKNTNGKKTAESDSVGN